MPSPITMIAMRHGVTNSTRAVLKRMRGGSAQVLPVDTADEAGECMVLRVDGVEHRVTTASAGAPSAVFAVKRQLQRVRPGSLTVLRDGTCPICLDEIVVASPDGDCAAQVLCVCLTVFACLWPCRAHTRWLLSSNASTSLSVLAHCTPVLQAHIVTSCGHAYHSACFFATESYAIKSTGSFACPCCREALTTVTISYKNLLFDKTTIPDTWGVGLVQLLRSNPDADRTVQRLLAQPVTDSSVDSRPAVAELRVRLEHGTCSGREQERDRKYHHCFGIWWRW